MDDIMVKSKWANQLIANLEQTFAKLRANGIKLNPRSAFSGSRGVCYLVSSSVSMAYIRKMDPRPIYFGFWCLMTNTTKLDQ